MKKKLLAIGVAASLGIFAGAASAAPSVNVGGIGHTNIIPYFSTQNGNATLISITNTDQVNGKVVKVRFRGAEWSDDIFDFQVFLSPGDVFTGAVTSSGGLSKFATSDKTCTLPASVNQNFVPIRLQNTATGTLEGYVEIITMANIPEDAGASNVDGKNPLFTAIKHVNGVAPCTSTTTTARLENLLQDNWVTAASAPQVNYMTAPTGSLTSFATIINVAASKAFSNVATAVNYTTPRKAYFRQANDAVTVDDNLSADRIFFSKVAAPLSGGASVPAYQFDLPDLSSPLDQALWLDGADVGLTDGDATDTPSAIVQRNALTAQLQKSAVVAEFSTVDALAAATDIVISQPTRRYFYNYTQTTGTADATLESVKYTIKGDADTPYENLVGSTNRVDLSGSTVFYDREENKASSNIVISPTPPGGALSLKGEVSVIGINNGSGATGSLGALLTINDLTAVGAGGAVYEEGWAIIPTTTTASVVAGVTSYAGGFASAALPVIGFSASNAFNSGVGAAGTNYGTTLPLRYTTVAP